MERTVESRATHAVHSNRVSGRNQAPEMLHGGAMAKKYVVCGGVENPRPSSEWIDAAMQARGPGQGKTQQGWAMAKFFMHGRLLGSAAKQARADHRISQRREIAHLCLG